MVILSLGKEKDESDSKDTSFIKKAENSGFGCVLVDLEGGPFCFSTYGISGKRTKSGECEAVWPHFATTTKMEQLSLLDDLQCNRSLRRR